MSVSDIVHNLAKTVRASLSGPGELREKAKELPLVVLRTVLAGVGQAILFADRVRAKIRQYTRPRPEEGGPARVPEEERTGPERPERREPIIFAPRPVNGNGLGKGDVAAAEPVIVTPPARPAPAAEPPGPEKPAPAAERPAEPAPAPPPAESPAEPSAEPPAAAEPEPAAAPEPEPAAAPEPEPAERAAAPVPPEPVPGYANLSLASLRARMRGKSIAQMRELLDYEKATLGRPEVIRMFENRLAKLEAAERAG